MFHTHIETLLHHCVFQVNVRTGTYSVGRAVLVNVRRLTLHLKSLLLCIKDGHVAPDDFGTRLLEGSGSSLSRCSHFVLWL